MNAIEKMLQDDLNAINIMWNDRITQILMKKNPTPEEVLIKEAYRRGYWEGTYDIASKHNCMLNKALYAAEHVRYKKMLKGFLARYFNFLNSERSL